MRIGAAIILLFLVLITLNGYGFEMTLLAENLVKNRLITP